MDGLLYGAFGRDALIDRLRDLADRNYQIQAWGNRRFPPGIEYDDAIEAIHFFYDDTRIADETDAMVGTLLKDQAEAEAIKRLISAFDVALNTFFIESVHPREYIDSPEWKDVIQAAIQALVVFTRDET